MLEKIEGECTEDDRRVGQKKPKCSGYGEHCETNLNKPYDTLPDLECPGCGRHCSFYKKWIKIKKDEYEKQKNAYTGQKDKCVNGRTGAESKHSTCDQNFVQNLRNGYQSIDSFLQKLVSCSKNNKDNGDGTINFKDTKETFGPAKNCKPCSSFKIDCKENGHCDSSKGTNCEIKSSIDAKDIETMGQPTEINMLVSDNSENGFTGVLDECKGKGIFEGIRKDVWTCGNVCGYNVCKPKKVDGKENGKNQIIIIRALFKIWLEYFLEDYNKIKKKLKPCKKKGGTSICTKNCADEWLKKKTTEWKNLKNLYLQQYENKSSDKSFLVKTILEEFKERPEFQNAIKPCKELEKFESFCGLHGDETSKKSKDGKERDLVVCLLEKLGKEATSCAEAHKENSDKTCSSSPQQTLDLDDQIDEDTENKVAHPKICGDMGPTQQQDEGEEDCKPSDTIQEVKDQKPKAEEESGTPSSPSPSEGTEERPPRPGPQPTTPPN
ncbi:hypothetical protein PFTANZ_05971, partial [Plasmodium falciparum Tanzania (2000708)]